MSRVPIVQKDVTRRHQRCRARHDQRWCDTIIIDRTGSCDREVLQRLRASIQQDVSWRLYAEIQSCLVDHTERNLRTRYIGLEYKAADTFSLKLIHIQRARSIVCGAAPLQGKPRCPIECSIDQRQGRDCEIAGSPSSLNRRDSVGRLDRQTCRRRSTDIDCIGIADRDITSRQVDCPLEVIRRFGKRDASSTGGNGCVTGDDNGRTSILNDISVIGRGHRE